MERAGFLHFYLIALLYEAASTAKLMERSLALNDVQGDDVKNESKLKTQHLIWLHVTLKALKRLRIYSKEGTEN